jgi:hypothetical protein
VQSFYSGSMGHRDLLITHNMTHNLSEAEPTNLSPTYAAASATPAASF